MKPNTLPHVIPVASLAELAAVHVAPLDEGVLAWVIAIRSYYVLEKASGETPNGTTKVAPNAGAPSAGAAGAIWSFFAGPGGSSGSGTIIQKQYGENQERPTVLTEPAPGGTFETILSVAITTTIGSFLDITASLSALTDGGVGSTNTEASIRILVDGVSSGLGATQSAVNDNNNLEPFASVTLEQRVAVAPGPHTVELQWSVRGDGGGDKLIGFLSEDQDGCSMFVEEVAA
jgi:hypothetical protein